MTQKEYPQARFVRPAGATEILLVRHGESQPATPGRPFPLIDGHGDPGLSANGRRQAVLVGERLRHLPIDAVYVTKLRRTRETAAPLCTHLGMTPVVEPNLHEVFLGDWEGGLFRIKAANSDPVYMRMHMEERWDIIPGAESTDAFHARLRRGLDNIAARHPDQLVAAVVHGGVIGQIISHAAGARPFAFLGADNTSISQIVMHQGIITVRRFNDAAHLTENLSTDSAMPNSASENQSRAP